MAPKKDTRKNLASSKKTTARKKNTDTAGKRARTVHPQAEKPIYVILGILLGAVLVAVAFLIAAVNRDVNRVDVGNSVPLRAIDTQVSYGHDNRADSMVKKGESAGTDGRMLDQNGVTVTSGSSAGRDGVSVTSAGQQVTHSSGVTVGVKKTKSPGAWQLMAYNKQEFDADDDEKLEIDNVCGENRGVTTYCKNTSSLRSTTAAEVGNKKCPACTVGQTCLLWNGVEEDDGDLEVKTATYLCE